MNTVFLFILDRTAVRSFFLGFSAKNVESDGVFELNSQLVGY